MISHSPDHAERAKKVLTAWANSRGDARTNIIAAMLAYADERVAAALRGRDAVVEEAIVPPVNGEPDPEWAAIRRAIDQFAGRVPTISKHRALHNSHLAAVVARLDAAGDPEAADTIVWQCWYRALDRERERFLLEDARAALHDAKEVNGER